MNEFILTVWLDRSGGLFSWTARLDCWTPQSNASVVQLVSVIWVVSPRTLANPIHCNAYPIWPTQADRQQCPSVDGDYTFEPIAPQTGHQ